MKSRVRSEKDGKDLFDVDEFYQVVDSVCQARYFAHPYYLQ